MKKKTHGSENKITMAFVFEDYKKYILIGLTVVALLIAWKAKEIVAFFSHLYTKVCKPQPPKCQDGSVVNLDKSHEMYKIDEESLPRTPSELSYGQQDAKDADVPEECQDAEIEYEDATPEEPVDNTPEETKAVQPSIPTQEQIAEKIEIEEMTKKQPKTRKRKA